MDAVGLIYYALVCGGLAIGAPSLKSKPVRVVIGLATGAVSALLLPMIRNLIG